MAACYLNPNYQICAKTERNKQNRFAQDGDSESSVVECVEVTVETFDWDLNQTFTADILQACAKMFMIHFVRTV